MTNLLTHSLLVLLLWSGSAIAQQQVSNARWVPYSANYTETVSIRGSSGSPTQNQTLSEEIRSDDGTLLTVVTVGGKKMSGKLWQASGQMFSIDYLSKRAVLTGKLPRRHPFTPPDASLGTKTIAGIQCTVYPLHTKNGNGTICVDMDNDLIASAETHTDSAGVHQDYVKQLTSINLTSPINNSTLQIPTGFTQLVPSR